MSKKSPLLEIEEKYLVEKIKVNGLYFWPFVRNYIGSQIHFNQDREVKISSKNIVTLITSLNYGFFNLFKKVDYLFISSSDQRRNIDDQFTERMDYFIEKLNPKKCLLIEQTNPKHFDINKVKTKNISSKTWFYLLEKIVSYFIFTKIENEEILINVLNEYQLKTNYKNLSKKFHSQYIIFKTFLKIKKPKKVFLTVAYVNCARVKAAKDLGIEVIEFQHGIINKSHYGYNVSKLIDSNFYPDFLLSFGEKEIEVFDSNNHYIEQDNVLSLGSFYIDHLLNVSNNKKHPKIIELSKKYKQIIAFSCQDAFDDLWIPFLTDIAIQAKDLAFILMPRHKSIDFYEKFSFPQNVSFIPELNTYEIILQVDIHTTINSTTAIEAVSLGTQNVLINIDNLSKRYLNNVLKEFTYYADTPKEFIDIVQKIKAVEKKNVINSNSLNIKPNFQENIELILDKIE